MKVDLTEPSFRSLAPGAVYKVIFCVQELFSNGFVAWASLSSQFVTIYAVHVVDEWNQTDEERGSSLFNPVAAPLGCGFGQAYPNWPVLQPVVGVGFAGKRR